eukprot:TRINITY_DN5427_c2_g1_i3.p1 TRINITY_DN5427_c2_g1~~TRINITY_DN5427_c2_g1_i3.p1  ORF type:complete len:113 (-),score=48.81 TRINITY_DN5427_c2_g1_i3:125-463(-)
MIDNEDLLEPEQQDEPQEEGKDSTEEAQDNKEGKEGEGAQGEGQEGDDKQESDNEDDKKQEDSLISANKNLLDRISNQDVEIVRQRPLMPGLKEDLDYVLLPLAAWKLLKAW